MDEHGVLTITDATGAVHRIASDRSGLVLRAMSNGTSEMSRFDHDGRCAGRVLWKRGPRGLAQWSVGYQWSAEGDLRRIEDSARGVTEFQTDRAHRLIGVKSPKGDEEIRLDSTGNVLAKAGLSGVELLEGNRLQRTWNERFSYDARGRLALRVRAENLSDYDVDLWDTAMHAACQRHRKIRRDLQRLRKSLRSATTTLPTSCRAVAS